MKLNTYRLSSLEDPTDEQLHALMEQVAVAARESSRKAKRELERRMQEVREKLKAYRAKNVIYPCDERKKSDTLYSSWSEWFG